jgi:uncharacterized protein (TIGR02246 family)
MHSRTKLQWIALPSLALLLAAAMSAEPTRGRDKAAARTALADQLAQAQQPPARKAAKQAERAKGAPAKGAAATTQEQDEKAIRATVDAMTKAFNAKDAPAVAELFTPNAEIVDEEGNAYQGREAIKEVFAAGFAENPKSQIKSLISSIRFVTPSVAVEEGMSTVRHEENKPVDRSRYTVVHVKLDGKWLMASARDYPDENPEGSEELKLLAPMIGSWVDESPESLTMTSYQWNEDHRYLLGEFTLHITGRISLSGSVRIGWDPLTKKIHSWVFDSKGGFGEGVWTRDENRWVVKMTGVSGDGKASSATNITTFVTKDRMTWESHDRVVGDEVMPDIETIMVVRMPPQAL